MVVSGQLIEMEVLARSHIPNYFLVFGRKIDGATRAWSDSAGASVRSTACLSPASHIGTGWRRVVDDAAQLVFNLDEEFAAFLQGCACR